MPTAAIVIAKVQVLQHIGRKPWPLLLFFFPYAREGRYGLIAVFPGCHLFEADFNSVRGLHQEQALACALQDSLETFFGRLLSAIILMVWDLLLQLVLVRPCEPTMLMVLHVVLALAGNGLARCTRRSTALSGEEQRMRQEPHFHLHLCGICSP